VTCFSPLTAWQTDGGEIIFSERGKIRRELQLPCGQCVGCRLRRSRDWAIRCMHESQSHDVSCFVTLTYDAEHLPAGGQLVYRHFQLFMKRLRKRFPGCRFFMCGEYGETTWRPHFHCILFGVSFDDRELWRKSSAGFDLYRSKTLSSIWDRGAAEIGELSVESAQYVAGYCMKKVTGPLADAHYCKTDLLTGEIVQLTPEFARMSLKPGIGADWLSKYHADVYVRDGAVCNGTVYPVPRFYDKKLEELDSDRFVDISVSRYLKSFKTSVDSSVDRLRAREIVTRARVLSRVRDF